MKLRLFLFGLCLFGVGVFSRAQDKKTASPPVVERVRFKAPKAQYDKDGNLIPPPPPPPVEERVRFKAPKSQYDKDGKLIPPPPPPVEANNVPPPPPPVEERVRFKAPKARYDKDGKLVPPPPPRVERKDVPPPPPPRPPKEGKTSGLKTLNPPAQDPRG